GEDTPSDDEAATAPDDEAATDPDDEAATAPDDEAATAPDDEAMVDESGPPEEAAGFDGETITLGYLTDQSGPLAIVGNSILTGSQVYWDAVNSEGGIAGMYPVELEVGDTQDSEATTVQEFQRIKDDVVMFAQVLSTPPTQALLEFLEEDGIIAVPGSLAAQWASEPFLLPNGTAYELEMINLADWYVNESGLAGADDTFCVIRTNDKYGEDTIRGVEFAGEQLGFEIAEEQTLARGDTAFTAQVTAFADAGCDVVFTITVAFETNGLLAEANAQGFEPLWLGALPSYVSLLALGNPDLYTNFYVALDTPNFTDTDVPGMATFLERWEAFGDGDPNTFHLSGYFQSIAIHALLEDAVAAGDLGRDGLQQALADLGEVDVQGLADNYVYGTPENRIPARANRIYLFDVDSPPNLVTEVATMESPLTEQFVP
ncbi:MAG: ABC transporter substrate-binding protein, partial [Acidimicrobiia bacterium]|nr:ABC transporter substrate-binding protein [Acidimicrobiia bacterium]